MTKITRIIILIFIGCVGLIQAGEWKYKKWEVHQENMNYIKYITHGKVVHENTFGFVKETSNCKSDILWLTIYTQNKVENINGKIAQIEISTDKGSFKINARVIDIVHLTPNANIIIFSDFLANEHFIELLRAAEEAKITILAPKEVVQSFDIPYEKFSLSGFTANYLKAVDACTNPDVLNTSSTTKKKNKKISTDIVKKLNGIWISNRYYESGNCGKTGDFDTSSLHVKITYPVVIIEDKETSKKYTYEITKHFGSTYMSVYKKSDAYNDPMHWGSCGGSIRIPYLPIYDMFILKSDSTDKIIKMVLSQNEKGDSILIMDIWSDLDFSLNNINDYQNSKLSLIEDGYILKKKDIGEEKKEVMHKLTGCVATEIKILKPIKSERSWSASEMREGGYSSDLLYSPKTIVFGNRTYYFHSRSKDKNLLIYESKDEKFDKTTAWFLPKERALLISTDKAIMKIECHK